MDQDRNQPTEKKAPSQKPKAPSPKPSGQPGAAQGQRRTRQTPQAGAGQKRPRPAGTAQGRAAAPRQRPAGQPKKKSPAAPEEKRQAESKPKARAERPEPAAHKKKEKTKPPKAQKPPKEKKTGKAKAKVIIGNILWVLLLVAILGSAVMYAMNTSPDKSIFGYRFYEVLSGSMTPTMPKGDLVIVKVMPVEDIEVGEIVTVAADTGTTQTTYTHRMINKYTDPNGQIMVQTQGDAVGQPDPEVNGNRVIGKAVGSFHYLGTVLGFIRGNPLMVIIFLVALIAIGYGIKLLFSKEDQQEEEAKPKPESGALEYKVYKIKRIPKKEKKQ